MQVQETNAKQADKYRTHKQIQIKQTNTRQRKNVKQTKNANRQIQNVQTNTKQTDNRKSKKQM